MSEAHPDLPGFEILAFTVECDEAGKPVEYMPQDRYVKRNQFALNPHGRGPFCRLRVHQPPTAAGVYAFTVDGRVMYIGECQNAAERFGPRGYGAIQPKNCFQKGQPTNCKINNAVLLATRAGNRVEVWFLASPSRKVVEADFIRSLRPPWNGNQPGGSASTFSPHQ